jgi:hypothetical protein
MKFYHKYQTALEKEGYRVDEHGYVWDSMGNQSAGEDNYGNVQSKDANVTEICRLADISAAAVNKSPKTTIKKTSSKKKKADE